MSERRQQLRALADDVAARDDVQDAWLAKSFSDRLFVVEVPPGDEIPAAVERELHETGLRGAEEVYDAEAPHAGYAGKLDDGVRYRYVDCETRGELQSYVVE